MTVAGAGQGWVTCPCLGCKRRQNKQELLSCRYLQWETGSASQEEGGRKASELAVQRSSKRRMRRYLHFRSHPVVYIVLTLWQFLFTVYRCYFPPILQITSQDPGKLTGGHKAKATCLSLPDRRWQNTELNPLRPACLYLSPFSQVPSCEDVCPSPFLSMSRLPLIALRDFSVLQKRRRTQTQQQSPSLGVWTGQKKKGRWRFCFLVPKSVPVKRAPAVPWLITVSDA